MNIMVLGAGPAGLLAAHAATLTGHDVTVLSKKRKSYMRGAQYLHAPIPMIQQKAFWVDYVLEGTVDGYREKIYKDPRTKVSVESLVGTHMAWDIRQAYDTLWDWYGERINEENVSAKVLDEILDGSDIDMVINSIPLANLCENPHHMFTQEEVWVTEVYRGQGENRVTCSGDLDHPWYRTSAIDGWYNTEYPQDKKPPLSEDKVHRVIKPVSTNCVCMDRICEMNDLKYLGVGRYGKWTKGVLAHHAFYDTFAALDLSHTTENNQ